MADKNYRIIVTNQVTVNSAGTPVGDMPPVSIPSMIGEEQPNQGMGGTGRAISAQLLVRAGSRLLSATGNQEIAQTVGNAARIGFNLARAATGDPVAIANLALDVATKALETARKNAELANETDMVRYRSGLMDLTGLKVRKTFLTGRYVYSRE